MDEGGLLTPFGELGVEGEASRVRPDARLEMLSGSGGPALGFELHGEQKSGTTEETFGRSAVFQSRVARDFGHGLGAVEFFCELQASGAQENDKAGVRVHLGF